MTELFEETSDLCDFNRFITKSEEHPSYRILYGDNTALPYHEKAQENPISQGSNLKR